MIFGGRPAGLDWLCGKAWMPLWAGTCERATGTSGASIAHRVRCDARPPAFGHRGCGLAQPEPHRQRRLRASAAFASRRASPAPRPVGLDCGAVGVVQPASPRALRSGNYAEVSSCHEVAYNRFAKILSCTYCPLHQLLSVALALDLSLQPRPREPPCGDQRDGSSGWVRCAPRRATSNTREASQTRAPAGAASFSPPQPRTCPACVSAHEPPASPTHSLGLQNAHERGGDATRSVECA